MPFGSVAFEALDNNIMAKTKNKVGLQCLSAVWALRPVGQSNGPLD